MATKVQKNPMAMALRHGNHQPKRIASKKRYTRKVKHKGRV